MSKREILFRGKRIDNGEWVEGYLLEISEDSFILNFTEENGELFHNMYQLESGTVCQYTELNDKNGRKIFDGDIVRIVNTDRENQVFDIGQISFEEGAWFLCGEMLCWFDNAISFGIEVIGNIFDNPELIH